MEKSNEFRVFGTPGSGKTSRLATRDIPRAVEKYGSDGVMVTSFTKAAAREISFKRSRKTGTRIKVAPENVGTIHSILYHALDRPDITEAHYIPEWNKKHPKYPITGSKVQSSDEIPVLESGKNTLGDRLLSMVNIRRNQMIPFDKWTSQQKKFYEDWAALKKDTRSIDFTDMIEAGLYEFDSAPNNPNVIFVDEAQDFTRLQLGVIRKWSKNTDWTILVGDDDQTIFSFIGSTYDTMLTPVIDKKFKTVLEQSYRVPQKILDRALMMILRVSPRREPKTHLPRLESDGSVAVGELLRLRESYHNVKPLIKRAQTYMEKGMSVVFLASCSYMLEPLKREFRRLALPYHNPYRRHRRDWNPLHHHGTLNDFLEQGPDEKFWTVPQFVSWAKHLKVGPNGLARKIGKRGIARLAIAINDEESGLHTCREVLSTLLEPAAVKAALSRDVDWFIKNVTIAKSKSLEYPIEVFKKHGKEGIEKEPLLSLGTIHSVKGATFDVVFLFPDVSYLADIEMGRRDGMDAACRLFYVAMTRAKHSLLLCQPTVKRNSKVPRMYMEL